VDTTDWLDCPSGIESGTMMEQAIYLEQYEQVISLARLP
jgi:hypothetical protein